MIDWLIACVACWLVGCLLIACCVMDWLAGWLFCLVHCLLACLPSLGRSIDCLICLLDKWLRACLPVRLMDGWIDWRERLIDLNWLIDCLIWLIDVNDDWLDDWFLIGWLIDRRLLKFSCAPTPCVPSAGATIRSPSDWFGGHPQGVRQPRGHPCLRPQHVDSVGHELRVFPRGEKSREVAIEASFTFFRSTRNRRTTPVLYYPVSVRTNFLMVIESKRAKTRVSRL